MWILCMGSPEGVFVMAHPRPSPKASRALGPSSTSGKEQQEQCFSRKRSEGFDHGGRCSIVEQQ